MFTFELGKGMNYLIPQKWIKLYNYCSTTMIALALDNP